MSQLVPLTVLLQGLIESKFYGEVLVKLENGHIVVIKKTESIKLPEQREGENGAVW